MDSYAGVASHSLPPPVSALQYLQRPPDPLKDGSIFQVGPRFSHNNGDVPFTITREKAFLGMSPHRGPPSFTPSPGIRALPAAAMETPDSGQLSRSEIARQIRANFDSLVRASPLPRAVERLVTPSAGRLAALAPPWVQSSPGYAAQEADATPQHLLQIQPHRQSGFLSPAPHSIESNPADTAPPSRLSIGDQAGRPPRPPSTVIRPIPLAPSFGCSPDALYTPRPIGRGRDPRLTRSSAQASPAPPAAASGISEAQPEPEQAALPAARQVMTAGGGTQVSTEAKRQGGVPEGSASELALSDSAMMVTGGAAAWNGAQEQSTQQERDQLEQSRRAPKESRLRTREADAATITPLQTLPDLLADELLSEAPDAAREAALPGHTTGKEQAHETVWRTDNEASTAQAHPCSQTSEPPKRACRGSQQEERSVGEHASAAPSGAKSAKAGRPQLQADNLNGAAHRISGRRQQGVKACDDEPSASNGNPSGVHLAAQAPYLDVKQQHISSTAPSLHTRKHTSQRKSASSEKEGSEAETVAAQVQVSRTGRVRAPPLAFWANERISRNADQEGGSAIERGFSDQLAQQCESFVQSPGKKPKKVSQTSEPVEDKSRKFIKTQRQSTEDVQKSKGVKRKQPEAEGKLSASSQSADATTIADPAPTVNPTPPAWREEKPLLTANGRKPRGYQCEECQKKKQGHCGTEKAVKACLRRQQLIGAEPSSPAAPSPAEAAHSPAKAALMPGVMTSPAQQEKKILLKADGRKPQGYQCEECQKRHQGHCGTERAVKACLRRRPAQTAQPGSPPPASHVPHNTGGAQAQGAALPTEEVPGRTLGIAAKLQALARRPSDAVEAAQPHNAAKHGQKVGIPGQQPGPPSRTTGKASLQRTASKHGSLSARALEKTLTDRSAAAKSVRPAPAEDSRAINPSKPKKAAKGKHARGPKAGALADTEQPSISASASHKKASSQPKRRADDLNHDSTSTAPKHADSIRDQLGKGSGPGQTAPTSKMRKLTKAGNTTAAKQEVRRLDLGANASSGTSNEGDDAQADDGDNWSEEQNRALQRAYLVAEDPTAPNFWHNVAQHVSGKTAQECQNRLWAAHPTPKGSKGGNPGAYALAAEADSDNSPLMPPPRKNAAGGSMKPAPGATRKWARQVRWHERASQAASAAGAVQQPDQAPAAAKSSMNSTLLAAMQQQQRTDRYIDALIRKRGPLHKWAKGATARRVAPALAPMSLSHPELQGAVAAIASATQGAGDIEADEEASDHDQYWSDDS